MIAQVMLRVRNFFKDKKDLLNYLNSSEKRNNELEDNFIDKIICSEIPDKRLKEHTYFP